MDPLHKLIQYFGEFPGIGPRQARRFAYFLLTKNPAYLDELSHLIVDIKKDIRICSMCFRFYSGKSAGNSAAPNLCSICADTTRDQSELMVVARDVDLEAIEKSHTYNGLYFVLGGTIPILDKNPEARVRLKELLARAGTSVKEIVLSMNANPEGEHTADIIRSSLRPITDASGAKITVLGRGLSTGTELEYSDAETIKNALKNRA